MAGLTGFSNFQFPLIEWIMLIIYHFPRFVLDSGHLLITIILLVTGQELVASVQGQFIDLVFSAIILVMVVLYPLLSIIDAILGITDLLFWGLMAVDNLIFGGTPILISPPPGNVLHIVFNAPGYPGGNWSKLLTNVLIALTYVGLEFRYRGSVTRGIIAMFSLSYAGRRDFWKTHYGETTPQSPPDGDGGGDGGGGGGGGTIKKN